MPAILCSCPTRKELGLLIIINNTKQTYKKISSCSININNHSNILKSKSDIDLEDANKQLPQLPTYVTFITFTNYNFQKDTKILYLNKLRKPLQIPSSYGYF